MHPSGFKDPTFIAPSISRTRVAYKQESSHAKSAKAQTMHLISGVTKGHVRYTLLEGALGHVFPDGLRMIK